MKWLYLIIIAMLAGAFAYWFAGDNTSSYEGTPIGPAKEFVYAATEGNYDEIPYFTAPEAEDDVMEAAKWLNSQGVDPRAVKFKEAADMKNTYTGLVNGKFLTIIVKEQIQDEWVISGIDFES